jgi:hypothetical protein
MSKISSVKLNFSCWASWFLKCGSSMILPHPFAPRCQFFFLVQWQRSFIKARGVVQADHAVVQW